VTMVIAIAVLLASFVLSFRTLRAVQELPGWAYKHAHRGPKAMWVWIALICLVPPLGLISFVLWAVFGWGVKRAWAEGDPEGYNEAVQRANLNAAYQASRREGRD
jgi:hypothetical protein